MKGVIVNCLAEMVARDHGKERWGDALEKAGIDRKSVFFATEDVDDDAELQVVNTVCQVLDITLVQAADAFGEYWATVFAPRVYGVYFSGVSSARDFLLRMDAVHLATTKNIPGARPPRFGYEWKDDNTLIMTYQSHRGLIDIMIGLIKGVGKYYKEDLQVRKLRDDKAEIIFP